MEKERKIGLLKESNVGVSSKQMGITLFQVDGPKYLQTKEKYCVVCREHAADTDKV